MDVRVFETVAQMGAAAAQEIATELRRKLAEQTRVRVMFAAAPSQSATLKALQQESGVEWQRVEAFHMDEYPGLPPNAKQRFGNWLMQEFFEKVPLGKVNLMQPEGDPERACEEYAALLRQAPVDVVLLGIGTNGHLAFNDPPADLADKRQVKVVELDEMCREQQVFDGCFSTLVDVPKTAMTVTVPELLKADRVFGSVPGAHKREAVRAMLQDPVSGACPATALRQHPRCVMFLDRASYPAELGK